MSVNVQPNYTSVMRPGFAGTIIDMVDYSTITRLCETAAGIGFGVAVSQGTGDKGAIVGGSSFVGLTVRDITLTGTPVDMQSSTPIPVDTYGRYANMGIMTRGHMLVNVFGNVVAGGLVYYDATTGKLAGSASGAGAQGSIVYTLQPVADTITTINGTVVTWKASGATGNQVNIGGTLGDSVKNLADFLNASTDTNLNDLQYAAYPLAPAGGGEGATTLLLGDKTVGTGGNSVAFSTNVVGATASGSTLSGGTAAATAITGAVWVTSSIAGGMAVVSLGIQK